MSNSPQSALAAVASRHRPRALTRHRTLVSALIIAVCGGAAPTVSRAAEQSSPAPFVHRANASWSRVTDSAGHVWAPRAGFVGGSSVTQRLLGTDVRRTVDDRLFSVSTLDTTGFSIEVPRAGDYRVRLLMAEGYFTTPAQRVFDVTAEGEPLFSAVDIVAAAGRGAAYVRSGRVAVADGRLNLSFVARVNSPSVAAVEVVEATPTALVDDPDPVDSESLSVGVWRQRVDRAPLDPDSDVIAANLRQQVVDRWNGVAAFNAYQYNASIHTVPPGQPRVDIGFWDCQNKGKLPPGLLTGMGHYLNVPVPDNAMPAAGTDGEMTIHDPAADQAWEFWKMRRNAGTGGWEACWGGRIDNVSASQAIFDVPYGVSASGLLMGGGVVRLADVRRGVIEHALYLGVVDSQAYPEVSWPALRGDGRVADLYVVREGQRLRLDPTLDLSQYRLTPIGRMVAEAAQRYGFIVSDSSGAVAVATESGDVEAAVTGTNPWPGLIGGPTYLVMENFPWEHIQVVAADYGRSG